MTLFQGFASFFFCIHNFFLRTVFRETEFTSFEIKVFHFHSGLNKERKKKLVIQIIIRNEKKITLNTKVWELIISKKVKIISYFIYF